jgi:DNA-binding NarL/FixJ family response regulator
VAGGDLSPEFLRQVAEHTALHGPPALAAIARHYLAASPESPHPPECGLSEREAEVSRRIALGYSNKEIAAKLAVSVKTVETYKTRAMKKLKLSSRVDLVRYAVQRGWLLDGRSSSS